MMINEDKALSDDGKGHQINDVCVSNENHERNMSEITLPAFSPLELSSVSTKNINHTKRPHSKLQSAPLRVENVGRPADIAVSRVRERVAKYKFSLVQAAKAIDKQNTAELESTKKRQLQKRINSKVEREKKLRHETRLEMANLTATKLEGKCFRLEKLKVEVINFRIEKRRALKCLVRQEKLKRDEEESPTQILKKSNYFTIERGEDDDINENDDIKATSRDIKQLCDEGILDESDELRQKSDRDNIPRKPEEEMTMEEMRLAARSKAAEEIRMAKEVRRHEMAKLTKEREEENLALDKCEEGGLVRHVVEDLVAGVQVVTICKLLDCTKEELYDVDFSDSSSEPAIEMVENSASEDTMTVQHVITDLVQAIEGYDHRLLDLELMQSVVLAEIAALKGKDEFKISGERKQWCDIKKHFGGSTGNKSHTQKIPHWEGLERIKKGIGHKMKTFQLAAARVDRYRMTQLTR